MINELFDRKLDEFESKWFEWNEHEIVFWFKYKLDWFEARINNMNNNNNNNNNNTGNNSMINDEDSKENEIQKKNDEILSINFNKILFNLRSQKIRGKFLSVLNKSDLNNLGFELMKHQLIIYNGIQNIISKYPLPKENDVNDGIEGLVTDGTTYERSALESYLRKYKKFPNSHVVIKDIEQEMENWFVDDDLKEEIDKLLK